MAQRSERWWIRRAWRRVARSLGRCLEGWWGLGSMPRWTRRWPKRRDAFRCRGQSHQPRTGRGCLETGQRGTTENVGLLRPDGGAVAAPCFTWGPPLPRHAQGRNDGPGHPPLPSFERASSSPGSICHGSPGFETASSAGRDRVVTPRRFPRTSPSSPPLPHVRSRAAPPTKLGVADDLPPPVCPLRIFSKEAQWARLSEWLVRLELPIDEPVVGDALRRLHVSTPLQVDENRVTFHASAGIGHE